MSSSLVLDRRQTEILDAAVSVIGHFGIKKTSVDELAKAAGLSKQGLYLHFESKEELVSMAMRRYFEEGLRLVAEALNRKETSLQPRLVEAMDAWFGRHLAHFNPASLEVVEPRTAAVSAGVEEVKTAFQRLLSQAISKSPEYRESDNACSPTELASVLFQFGLTWKEGHESRAAFRETLERCVRACLQLERSKNKKTGGRR